MTRLIRLCLLAGIALLTLVAAGGQALASGVDPASYSATLTHGQSVTITKTVHTPAIPPKVDIMFLADTTGSMGSSLSNVQTNASSTLAAIRLAQPDSFFGAANYTDFGCTDPNPYLLNQGITSSVPAALTGIAAWFVGNGCDTPEAQVNALFQIATDPASNFRPGSTREIVWFGDSSGHDPSGGHSLAAAITALQAANIHVIAIPVNSGAGDGLDSTGQATAVATATGGQVLPSATPAQITAAILTGLSNLPVTVTPVATCDPGLSATYVPSSKTVTSGTDATFSETLTVAGNAPEGTLHCTVDFLLNGNHVDGFQQTVNIDVPEQPIAATGGFTFTGTEPASVSGTVATFTDPDPFATAGEYSASINWGDSSSSPGTITGPTGGPFTVSGSHTYADEGNYTITVTITDVDNASNSATVTDSATVADAALTAGPLTLSGGVEGVTPVNASFGFTDANAGAPASDFTATCSWGDTSSSAGTVTGIGGAYTVTCSHTYGEEGSYPVAVTVNDDGGSTTSATGTANVADAPLASQCAAAPVSPQAFSGPTATFTDADPNGIVTDYSATISWGDTSTSAGTISGGPGIGPYTVSGSHTYTSTGFFTVTTTITDHSSTTTAACKVLIFAFAPGGGSFVIGDKNSANGTAVTFWGAQWWKLNSLSGGSAPAAFKGFAEKPATPSCGTGWSADPGNSTPPPDGPLPAYMGVIVSSSISKSGSTISGNTPHIVVVQTNPGYAGNPGHAGTGTVVALFC